MSNYRKKSWAAPADYISAYHVTLKTRPISVRWVPLKPVYVPPSQRTCMTDLEVLKEILTRTDIDLSRSVSKEVEDEIRNVLNFFNHVYLNQNDADLLDLLHRWLIHTHTNFFSYLDEETLFSLPVFFWEQVFSTADWHVQVRIIEQIPLHVFVCMVNSGFIEDRYGDGYTMPDVIKEFRKRPEFKNVSKETLRAAFKENDAKIFL